MMKDLSDERLEKMLTAYCKADGTQSFVYDIQAPFQRKKEKRIPFARVNRTAAAAASLVLVSVLSLIIYFSFGNQKDNPLAVAPSTRSVIPPSAPARGSGGEFPDNSDGNGTVSPTEKTTGLWQSFEDLAHQPTESTDGTTKKENNTVPTTPLLIDRLKLFLMPKATEKSSPTPTENTTSPTEKHSSSTEISPSPTEQAHIISEPTVPITPPRIEPTEDHPDPWLPEGTEPCDPPGAEPTEPDEGSSGEPCDPPSSEVPPPVDLYGSISKSRMPDDRVVYCKVYDNRGRLMGDRNLYSSEHLAEIVHDENMSVLVVYTTPEGMIDSSGYYNYVFYDANGTLLAQGQEYVEVD